MVQKTQIGKILLEKKKISQLQLGQALKRQLVSGGRLASNLLDIGAASEEDLLGALGEQMGIPAVDLSRTIIPFTALKFIPERVALDAKILPLKVDEERIFLAVGDPNDKQTLDEVTFVTGRKVEAYIALETRLVTAIEEAYDLLNGIRTPCVTAERARPGQPVERIPMAALRLFHKRCQSQTSRLLRMRSW